MVYESFRTEDTFHIGEKLGLNAKAGDVCALCGDLGTGKTVFTKGFAAGLGITRPVSSPTFTILQIYEEGRIPLYHFDVYRIGGADEMEETGLDEYLYADGVSLVEWADRIGEILPPETKWIRIEKDLTRGPDYRRIIAEDGKEDGITDGQGNDPRGYNT